ncbi:MAG TPA: DUF2892 domain-containing protein [Clostridia bacterium]|jgi:PII-like signaling protein|nr:DUF2892 domain-containing protein [Clostridia bacterium]
MTNRLYFRKNVGQVDKIIRIALGSAMVLVPALLGKSSVKHAILHGIGGATVLEGMIGY